MSTTVLLSIVSFCALCVVVVAGLVFAGRDPSAVVQFIAGLIPPTIGVILLTRQNQKTQDHVVHASAVAEDNAATLTSITSAVNGKLDAKFSNLAGRIASLDQTQTNVMDQIRLLRGDVAGVNRRLNAANIPALPDNGTS